eukprot:902775-Pelagomonas_calceolata.AAC.3
MWCQKLIKREYRREKTIFKGANSQLTQHKVANKFSIIGPPKSLQLQPMDQNSTNFKLHSKNPHLPGSGGAQGHLPALGPVGLMAP